MDDIQLTYTQNLRAARIFLNLFGLTLEDKEELNEDSIIKIYNSNMNSVGSLYFSHNKTVMKVSYDDNYLEASYENQKAKGLVDYEYDIGKFIAWCSTIKFLSVSDNGNIMNGEMLISASMDTAYGIRCNIRPLVKCKEPNGKTSELMILRDGYFFSLDIKHDDYNEKINIEPYEYSNCYILHDIKKGDFNSKSFFSWPYRRYAGVFPGTETDSYDDNMLHVFFRETTSKIVKDVHQSFTKVAKDDEPESRMQKGQLMHGLDPMMYETIMQMLRTFSFGNVSLLDNLISTCYDLYSDKEIEALLGVKRKKMNYQDGLDSLVDSYFGIENPKKMQKVLNLLDKK